MAYAYFMFAHETRVIPHTNGEVLSHILRIELHDEIDTFHTSKTLHSETYSYMKAKYVTRATTVHLCLKLYAYAYLPPLEYQQVISYKASYLISLL